MEAESKSHEISPVTKTTLFEELPVKKSYSCGVCGRNFTCRSNLYRHKKIHTGEKPFSCSVCVKCSRSSSDLSKHKRIHTGEKPFSCSVCGECFNRSFTLIEHKRIHTGQKPLSCSVCGVGFRFGTSLSKHMKTHIDKVSLVDDSWSSDVPQGQINESTPIVNYVGISPNESFGDMSVKEEVDPLGELPMTQEFDPAVESSVKEEFYPLEVLIKEEIDSLEMKEEIDSHL